jgi:FeS assembly SUF system regulator
MKWYDRDACREQIKKWHPYAGAASARRFHQASAAGRGLTQRALTTIYSGPIRSEFAFIRPFPVRLHAMIILSKLADYGVIVATHLAADADRQQTAAAIADETRLPRATVAKILKGLAHAGLVTATRGAAGGYRLARRANAISVAEVVAAIDGDIGLTQCSVHVAECARTNYCPTRPHWAAINRAVAQALMAVSLDAMITPAAFVARQPAATIHAATN